MSEQTEPKPELQIIRQSILARNERGKNLQLRREVSILRQRLANILQEYDRIEIPSTGWTAFLKRAPDGSWSCVGCHDEDAIPDDLPDFDLVMPIPDPASLAEFEGL